MTSISRTSPRLTALSAMLVLASFSLAADRKVLIEDFTRYG